MICVSSDESRDCTAISTRILPGPPHWTLCGFRWVANQSAGTGFRVLAWLRISNGARGSATRHTWSIVRYSYGHGQLVPCGIEFDVPWQRDRIAAVEEAQSRFPIQIRRQPVSRKGNVLFVALSSRGPVDPDRSSPRTSIACYSWLHLLRAHPPRPKSTQPEDHCSKAASVHITAVTEIQPTARRQRETFSRARMEHSDGQHDITSVFDRKQILCTQ